MKSFSRPDWIVGGMVERVLVGGGSSSRIGMSESNSIVLENGLLGMG